MYVTQISRKVNLKSTNYVGKKEREVTTELDQCVVEGGKPDNALDVFAQKQKHLACQNHARPEYY